MKFRHRLLLITDLMIGRKKTFFLTIIMIILSFFLFDMIYTLFVKQTYDIDKFYGLFLKEPENVYRVEFQFTNEEDLFDKTENMLSFYEKLENVTGVNSVSGFSFFNLYFDEFQNNDEYFSLMEKREVVEDESVVDLSRTVVLAVEPPFLNIMDLEGKDASIQKFIDYNGEYIPVLAGIEFSEVVDIGNILTSGEHKYEVVGFLEEDSLWPIHGVSQIAYDELRNLDYCLVLDMSYFADEWMLSTINSKFFVIEDEENRIEIINSAQSLARELELDVSLISVKQSMEDIENDESVALKMYMKLLIFMIFICIITAMASSLISILTQKRKLGIWLANGVLPKDIYSFIFIEQFIRVILSAGIAYSLGMWYGLSFNNIYQEVHSSKTLGAIVLLAFVTYVFTTSMPCLYLRKQKPVELMHTRSN